MKMQTVWGRKVSSTENRMAEGQKGLIFSLARDYKVEALITEVLEGLIVPGVSLEDLNLSSIRQKV